MQKTAISWTKRTWNFVHGCSKVSDGCAACYAMKLSLDRGWTTKPWTLQNESENVLMKPHKLVEVYGKDVESGDRIFVNSMSDMFHRAIPDWYKAVGFCLMLDRSDLTFQILTKRPELTVDWEQRFYDAVRSAPFKKFIRDNAGRRGRWQQVLAALLKAESYTSPWGDNIWMGTSVEDARVISRIDHLRKCGAKVKFISAEPLLGPYPADTDLSGIDWVIVGGESGDHMTRDNGRWMEQSWARTVRDLCLDQGVAYFYKQDSAKRTEVRTALEHEDGSYFIWQQYPGDLSNPIPATRSGKPLPDSNIAAKLEWEARVADQRTIAHKEPQPTMKIIAAPQYINLLPAPALLPLLPAPKPVHTLTVYTAQMGVRDTDALDITIKSADTEFGELLAPLWVMVIPHKNGLLSDEEYTEKYYSLLRDRYTRNPDAFKRLLQQHERLVLKCYCGDGNFCHRHLAVDILEKTAAKLNIQFVRGGELKRITAPEPVRQLALL